MARAVNDATLQKAGDIYQYLIALKDCFDLSDGDTLQIETNGDVSIINDMGGRFQKEVKHHFGKNFISDRDIDFWKYRPIDLNFGLTDGSFDIYQHQKSNENIRLYEMGSGANWVSCHIALFLSFLHYFSAQENSPMPLIMFFDQPSQVYFPQGDDKGEIAQADLIAVNKMYKKSISFVKKQEYCHKSLL